MSVLRSVVLAGVVAIAGAGCGPRSPVWNVDVSTATAMGLSSGVALVDDADHQVVVLTVNPDRSLNAKPISIGHSVAATATSTDGSTLFVLATGDPKPSSADEQPSLTVIQIDSSFTVTSTQFTMADAFKSLAVDPMGEWAVAYQQTGFVTNANELLIFDLTGTHSNNPVTRTLQSLGGTPQQLTFTPQLLVDPALGPAAGGAVNGDRRLLVVQTQIDVTLLDLDHAFDPSPPPEFTIPLTSDTTTAQIQPAAVVADGFDPTSSDDARIAVRASNSSDVFTITFGPPAPTDTNDFAPLIDETDVGGVPSDIAFARSCADGTLGLAALVPGNETAVLLNQDGPSSVQLPSSYSRLSLVTSSVATSPGSSPPDCDVALLWNGNAASGVALWTVGQPYFNIEITGVSAPIQTVLDVPNGSLKVLEPSDQSAFYVLDLSSRRVTTLQTSTTATLSISPDGKRAWAFAKGGFDLGVTDLTTSTTSSATTDAPIASVYDVGCTDGQGRALIALHMEGTLGASIFDATDLTVAPRRASALLLEAP